MRSIQCAIWCVLLVLAAAGAAGAFTSSLSLNSVEPNEVDVGSAGPVVMTATLIATDLPCPPFPSPTFPIPGTVEFSVDGEPVGSADGDGSGTATFSYDPSGLAKGSHTVHASFAGWDGMLDPSISNTMKLYVGGFPTALVLNSDPVCVAVGSTGPVVVTVTLTRSDTNAHIAGATIRFSVDGDSVGTATTNGDGIASLDYNPSGLGYGGHTLEAFLAAQTIGDTDLLASTSNRSALNVIATTSGASIGELGGGLPLRAAVQGNYAYVAAERCLSIFDVSDRSQPVLVGWCDTPGMAIDVAVDGAIAYVACPNGAALGMEMPVVPDQISVVDVADPTHPVLVTTWEIPYAVLSFELQGHHLFMCGFNIPPGSDFSAATGALLVYDVTNPSQPSVAATLDLGPGLPFAITLSGTRAYVLDCWGGQLFAVDISEPQAPTLASTLLLPVPAEARADFYDIACSGGYIYVDFSYDYHQSEPPWDWVEQGNLYVLQDLGGTLSLLGEWSSTGDRIHGVAASGTWAYVVGRSHVYTLDCSIPSSPTLNATYTQPDLPGWLGYLTLAGSDLFLGAYDAGLDILSLEPDPGNPHEVGVGVTAGGVRDIAVAGSYAYLASGTGGLVIVDFSSPASPTVAAACRLAGCRAAGVAVSGSHAYVAGYGPSTPALHVIDITDPHSPAVVGSCALSGSAGSAVVVVGNYAYVGGWSGLMVVDISDPTAPAEVATCTGDALWLQDLVPDPSYGGFLWGAGALTLPYGGSPWDPWYQEYQGAVYLNISDPLAPSISGFVPAYAFGASQSLSVDVCAEYYTGVMAAGTFGTIVVSGTDMASLYGICPSGEAAKVRVKGRFAYVADFTGSLRVVDVSNAMAPVEVAHFDARGSPQTLAVSGDYVHLGAYGWGVQVFPEFPQWQIHTLTITASASPATVPSSGTTNLTASCSDSFGHSVTSWSWDDGGAGGSFSPSTSVQNPTYTAPANTGYSDRNVILTVTATCDGANAINGSGSARLTVQPLPRPTTVVLNSVNPVCVLVDSSDLVAFTATLTRDDTSAAIAGATVGFSVDGSPVGTAVTAADGTVSLTYDPSALAVGEHAVQASFAGQSIGGIAFQASTSGTMMLIVAVLAPGPAVPYSITLISNDPSLTGPGPITTDGANLYVANNFGPDGECILSVPIGGGPATTVYPYHFYPNGCAALAITQIGSDLFWIDPNSGPATDTQILRAPKNGSGPVTAIYTGVYVDEPIMDGCGITTDGVALYTADCVQGRVHRLNPDGSGLTQLGNSRYGGFFNTEHRNAIAESGGMLYLVDEGLSGVISPQVATIPACGGPSFITIFAGPPFVRPGGGGAGIAVGNGMIFIADSQANNTIWSVPITGGAPTPLVSGAPFVNIYGLTFFDNALYVTDCGNGTNSGAIYRVTPAPLATTLVLNSVSPAQVTVGSSGPVAFTATLTRSDTSAAVVGATVGFSVDGSPVGTADTVAAGVATLDYDPSALAAGDHTVQASFAEQTIGGIIFLASTSSTMTLLVGNTPAGSSVAVEPAPGTEVTFSEVTDGGNTEVTSSSEGPEPPSGFQVGDPPLYYEVTTTATYAPPITICLSWQEGEFENEEQLRLFHYEGGAWVDVTTSVDTVNNKIYGQVSSLSLFTLVEPVIAPTTLALNSVTPASVTVGSGGPVVFTATLTRNDTSAGVVGATVGFTVDGSPAGTAVTATGGVATLNYNPSALAPGSHTVQASFAGETIGGIIFLASTSSTLAMKCVYHFIGFLPPVDNPPIFNAVKAGRTIPVKWQLTDAGGAFIGDLSIVVHNPLSYRQIADDGAPIDPLPSDADTTGATVLCYDSAANQFIFHWKTSTTFAGKCYELILDLNDGTQMTARFKFTR